MDSQASRGEHLDATAGREVVYCHACSHEWWKEDAGLQCPRCESEITEIVSPDNDPRFIEDGPALHDSPGRDRHRHLLDDDSDPDEADIEEHLHRGPSGFVLHRTIWNNSQRPAEPLSPNTRQPADPADGDQIIRRFIDMVNQFSVPPHPAEDTRPPPGAGGNGFGGPNVRTIYRGGPGGTTSFTIATGPIHIHQGGARSPDGPAGDPFQAYVRRNSRGHPANGPRITMVSIRANANQPPSIFSNMLAGAGPPTLGGHPTPGQGPRAAGGAPTLLQEILGMFNPANAAHGDAVYTQEALDRIISTLMDQNPQSNAAPPASEDALSKLERKKVDEKMLGPEGKAECTICIDELTVGDEVVVLPCKHWFHDQCVVMWLKEHNTCPICRTPMEEPNNGNNDAAGNGGGMNNAGDANAPHRDNGAGPGSSGNNHQHPAFWDDAPHGMPGHWGATTFTAQPIFFERPPPVPAHSTRPQRSLFRDWDIPHPHNAGNNSSQDASTNYDLPPRPSVQESGRMSSFRSRRDSHSPPSIRRHQSDSFRARQRSPSSGNWDRDRDSNQDGGSNHGPLNWLRNNVFSRGSGENTRDRRRS